MLRKILIAGAVTLGLTAPTLAAEFYVVQDTATKKCTIVDKKPTVTTSVVVGDGKVYTTRTRSRDRHEDGQGLHQQLTTALCSR